MSRLAQTYVAVSETKGGKQANSKGKTGQAVLLKQGKRMLSIVYKCLQG
jgi:hypothetical protein